MILLLLALMQSPESLREFKHVSEHFDSIDIYLHRYSNQTSVGKTYHFGRILADGSIGIVATRHAYENDSEPWEEFGERPAVNFYDPWCEVQRRCTTDADAVFIHVMPDGIWPPDVPLQLVTGFKTP